MLAKFAMLPVAFKVGGIIILALLFALGVQSFRLRSAHNALESCQEAKAELTARLELQNEMVEALRRQGADARRRASEAAAEARREAEAARGAVDSLRRSGGRVRAPSEPCEISDELQAAEGRL